MTFSACLVVSTSEWNSLVADFFSSVSLSAMTCAEAKLETFNFYFFFFRFFFLNSNLLPRHLLDLERNGLWIVAGPRQKRCNVWNMVFSRKTRSTQNKNESKTKPWNASRWRGSSMELRTTNTTTYKEIKEMEECKRKTKRISLSYSLTSSLSDPRWAVKRVELA